METGVRPERPPATAVPPRSSPRLIAGDPLAMQREAGKERRGQPASYTRFVVPLPYCLNRFPGAPTGPRFTEAGPADWLRGATVIGAGPGGTDHRSVFEASLDQERRDYFTRETCDVLHRRARWFVLRGEVADRFDFEVPDRETGGRTLRVRLRPPGLVLFDCPRTPSEQRRVGSLPHAMLVVEAWFEETASPEAGPLLDDQLAFNELFRYVVRPFERHARLPEDDGNPDHNYVRSLSDLPVDWREPSRRVGDAAQGGADVREALYLARWDWMLTCPVEIGGQWWRIVPEEWIDAARRWVRAEASGGSGTDAEGDTEASGWLLYADNRAYVWSCAVYDDAILGGAVRALGDAVRERNPMGRDLGYWVRLVNMDPLGYDPARCTAFEADWADRRTHRRWAHFGALQGFNYHGGAMLTAQCDEPPTWRHFGAMYFDQALLLLYLRTALFRFSLKLNRLSGAARRHGAADDDKTAERLQDSFESLRLEFALFTNLYQFPLLSNQQQGIELYTLCREHMDLEELFEEVQAEVQTTHEFLAQRAAQRSNDGVMRLTWVASAGLVLGLAVGLLGSDVFVKSWFGIDEDRDPTGAGRLVVFAALSGVFVFLPILGLCWLAARKIQQAMEGLRRELRGPVPLVGENEH